VTPSETTFDNPDDIPEYLTLSQYWFFVFIFADILISVTTKKYKYALNDTITSMNSGMFSMLPKIAGKGLSIPLYFYIHNNYRIVDLDIHSPWVWILGFLSQDLSYYLAHRAVHEAGVFWSFHQMHHSSEYYNLSTALRQGFIQDIGTGLVECCQSIIIPPPMFMTHHRLNTLYQFWIHNQVIPKLGPLEYILNTPSHHRVHHGRNPYCIDRNYAGVLIIWDRIFGTFEAERDDEKPVYGLVDNVKSFNQFWLQLFEFKSLGYDKGQMKDKDGKEIFPGFLGKLIACFGPPGYFPGVKTKHFFWWRCMVDPTEGIPEIEKDVKPHNPPLNLAETTYCIFIFLTGLVAFNQMTSSEATLSYSHYGAYIFYIIAVIQVVGYYLDKDERATDFDVIRLLAVCSYCIWCRNIELCAISALSMVFSIVFIRGPRDNGKSEKLS